MWFIGVELEQETSAPPPKKKNLDPPLLWIVIYLVDSAIHLSNNWGQMANHFYMNSDDAAKLFCSTERGVKGDRCAFKFALMQSFLIFFNFAYPYSFLVFSYLSCVFLQLETVILIFQCFL